MIFIQKKKLFLALLTSLFVLSSVNASISVDFYGTVSSSQDANMIKMTTDLFFNQFLALDNYVVSDKRSVVYTSSTESSSNLIFYIELQEDNGSWICSLNAIKPKTKQNVSSTKKYDSYYKLLLDSKLSLENILTNINGDIQEKNYSPEYSNTTTTNIDNLAGVWSGEEYIEKVIILRGGKGFIIFKNGASMNIAVESNNSIIKITQTSNPNASYYPNLSRQVAMEKAISAPPIVYELKLDATNVLAGTKTTLLPDGETSCKQGTVSVRWEKKN